MITKGPNGRNICRCGCGREVSWPRRNWFSQECVDGWRQLHDWTFVRRQVKKRDKGVCAVCGLDCIKLMKEAWKIREAYLRRPGARMTYFMFQCLPRSFLDRYPGFDFNMDYWQADHIMPRILGGTHAMENLRTLCLPCHRAATALLANKRAIARRAEKDKNQMELLEQRRRLIRNTNI